MRIVVLACLLGVALPGGEAAAREKKDALGQLATINRIAVTGTEPCRSEVRLQRDAKHRHGEEWPVKRGDRFAIEKRKGRTNYIDVKWDPFNAIQDPDMFVFNQGRPTLPADYCEVGGDISARPYAFGIYEVGDSQHPATLHALIHLPMKTRDQTAPLRANEFYLFVFSIPVDSVVCDAQVSEDKENGEVDDDWRRRCHALRRLVIARAKGEDDYVEAIQREILDILPASPNMDRKFHNGVIHGSF